MNNRQCEIVKNLENWFAQFWDDRSIKLIDDDGNYKKIPTNRFNACMMYIYENYVYSLEYPNRRNIKQYIYSDYIIIVEWYIAKCYEFDIVTINGLQILINRSSEYINSLKDFDNIKKSFIYRVIDINSNIDISNIDNSCLCISPDASINNINNNGLCNNIDNNDNNYINGCCNDINNNIANEGGELEGETIEKATAHVFDVTKKLYEAKQSALVNKLNDTPTGLIVNANNNNEFGLNYAKERIQEQVKARAALSVADVVASIEELN